MGYRKNLSKSEAWRVCDRRSLLSITPAAIRSYFVMRRLYRDHLQAQPYPMQAWMDDSEGLSETKGASERKQVATAEKVYS